MNNTFWALLIVPLCVAGCVNPAVNSFRQTKALPAYSAPAPPPNPVMSPKDPDAFRASDSGRSYSLTLKNADLRDVLLLLSKESGVSIVAERGLRGTVQVDAKNKKLGELLYTILKPLGYTASIENGLILVGRPKLTTRTFRVNYLKDKRSSTSNMNVSGFSAGSVSVSSTGQSDFWGVLENSLEMLVFGTSGKGRRDAGGFSISESEKKNDGKTALSSPSTTSRTRPETAPPVDTPDPFLSSTQITEGQLKQLVVNEIAGIVQITDFPENLDKIASFLADVEEGSKRQVLIQAHIMEVSLKDSFSLGIDWQAVFKSAGSNVSIGQVLAPATNVFKIGLDTLNSHGSFNLLLDAMKEQGNVNMLSSPKISALNNQKAVIKLTTKQVSWVSSKTTQNNAIGGQDTYTTVPQVDEVGIFLDVTPQIGQDNSITMQIHPSVSEIKEISVSPDKTSTKPVIDVREIDTMVDAKAGETVVIAGLISDKLSETKRGVPLLGDIPYLGMLFSYNKQERSKAELVIMMTPYILNARSIEDIRKEHELRLQNIGGDFHLINNLGSMVTEKNSRDWMMRKDTVREQPKESPMIPAAPTAPASPASPASPAGPVSQTEPPQIVPATPPETVRRMEQQLTEIERLENEVKSARELLEKEREEHKKRVVEASPGAKTIEATAGQSVETIQPAAVAVEPAPKQAAREPAMKTVMESVKTTSATSDREQTIYRSAVTAYKIGDCKESIKTFDTFLRLYPRSPFAQDAVYYRKDCTDRSTQAAK